MPGSTDARNGRGHRAYRRKRKILERKGLPCFWCGYPIDYSLPYNDPMSYTADHPIPISAGGHLVKQELEPMHRACNAKKGAKVPVTLRPND